MSTTTAPPKPQARPAPPTHTDATRTRSLGRYRALDTQQREVLHIQRPDGSALVIDYHLGTLTDGRLVAHLAPEEPAENAQVVCDLYLADKRRGRCRAVALEDFEVTRHATPAPSTGEETVPTGPLRDDDGYVYGLREVSGDRGVSELRWTRSHDAGREDRFDVVRFRDLVGSLQAYEPARTITRDALARCAEHVSTRRLRKELDRLAESPTVLNRELRREVQRRVKHGEVSMSEIAMRCGRIQRDARGNIRGETHWLARRIGEMPEAGKQKPGPWMHSDVLGLVARDA